MDRHSTSLLEMENSSAIAMASLLLGNILALIFQIFGRFLVSTFLYFFRLIPSFVPSLEATDQEKHKNLANPSKYETLVVVSSFGGGSGDSRIARALSQLLSIMDELPLNYGKYETVKSLAEKLISENLDEGCKSLCEVNTAALSVAFSRTLGKLEAAVKKQVSDHGGGYQIVSNPSSITNIYSRVKWVYGTVGYYGDDHGACTRFGKTKGTEFNRTGCSTEKLCADLLWLSEKLAACGSVHEAVRQWALASNLAGLALSTEPWLQGSLLRVSAFLLKKVRDQMGGKGCRRSKTEELRRTKLKMLMLWIPFLCRAGGGIDALVLSLDEKSEVERALDEIILSLRREEDQEKVLTLWLHHFMHCPSSNWPNLHSCYERWCHTSRTRLMVNQVSQNHDDIGI